MSYANPRQKGQSPTCRHCGKLGHDLRHCNAPGADEARVEYEMGKLRKAQAKRHDQERAAREERSAKKIAEEQRQAEIRVRKQTAMATAREALRIKRELAKPRCGYCRGQGHTEDRCVLAQINASLTKGTEISLASQVGHGKRKIACKYCGSYFHPRYECMVSMVQDSAEVGKRVRAMKAAAEQAIREAELLAREEDVKRKEAQMAADEAELQRLLAQERAESALLKEKEEAEFEALLAAERAEKILIEAIEKQAQASAAEHRALLMMVLSQIYGQGQNPKEVAKLLNMEPQKVFELLREAQRIYGEAWGIGLMETRPEDWEDL